MTPDEKILAILNGVVAVVKGATLDPIGVRAFELMNFLPGAEKGTRCLAVYKEPPESGTLFLKFHYMVGHFTSVAAALPLLASNFQPNFWPGSPFYATARQMKDDVYLVMAADYTIPAVTPVDEAAGIIIGSLLAPLAFRGQFCEGVQIWQDMPDL